MPSKMRLRVSGARYIWWDSLCQAPIYTAASQFGIANGFTYVSKTNESTKLYHIGNPCSQLHKDSYIVSKCNLMQFEKQFFAYSKRLRERAYQAKICYQTPIKLDALGICYLAVNQGLSKRIYFQNYELDFDPRFANLSILLINGKTIEEAAGILNISLRTLNNWIQKLKQMFHAKTLPQLAYHLSKIYLKD
jgi:hypothetical protein